MSVSCKVIKTKITLDFVYWDKLLPNLSKSTKSWSLMLDKLYLSSSTENSRNVLDGVSLSIVTRFYV